MAEPAVGLMTLRAAGADDAPCLAVLATQVFLDTYATEGIRPSLAREVLSQCSPAAMAALLAAPQRRFLLAERAGHLVGFAQLLLGQGHVLLPAGPAAELERLYVQRPFLGQGLGRSLLRRAECEAAAAGAGRLWLTAWHANQPALAFYARCGYADQGASWYEFEEERHENRLLARALPAAPGTVIASC
jgi:GNAT superfamily N-acetyltransferase